MGTVVHYTTISWQEYSNKSNTSVRSFSIVFSDKKLSVCLTYLNLLLAAVLPCENQGGLQYYNY